jgi:hypothetical protein
MSASFTLFDFPAVVLVTACQFLIRTHRHTKTYHKSQAHKETQMEARSISTKDSERATAGAYEYLGSPGEFPRTWRSTHTRFRSESEHASALPRLSQPWPTRTFRTTTTVATVVINSLSMGVDAP